MIKGGAPTLKVFPLPPKSLDYTIARFRALFGGLWDSSETTVMMLRYGCGRNCRSVRKRKLWKSENRESSQRLQSAVAQILGDAKIAEPDTREIFRKINRVEWTAQQHKKRLNGCSGCFGEKQPVGLWFEPWSKCLVHCRVVVSARWRSRDDV